MDRLFGDTFGDAFGSMESMPGQQRATDGGERERRHHPTYHLPVNITEEKDGYRIEAPVPGFRPDDVEVTYSDGILTIEARRRDEQERGEGSYMRREVAMGNYRRQISLPRDIRGDDIRAAFDNGVLNLIVPRTPRPEPKRIQVQAGERQLSGAGAQRRG